MTVIIRKLADLLAVWRTRTTPAPGRRKLDVFALNVGDEGAGKSTLAYLLAWLADEGFRTDPSSRFIFSFNDFFRITSDRALLPGSVVIVDEGMLLGHNLDFATKDSKTLVKHLNMMRERQLIVIYNVQRKRRLNPAIEERAHWLLINTMRPEDTHVKVYKRPQTNQFSKKGTSWRIWARFPFTDITPAHPGFDLWLAVDKAKKASGDDFAQSRDPEEASRIREASDQVKRILVAEGLLQ